MSVPFFDHLKSKFTECNSIESFMATRKELREYGIENLKQEMITTGLVDELGFITSGEKPFNPFARIVSKKMPNPCLDTLDGITYSENYIIAKNLPVNDEHYLDTDTQWLGRASMSLRHRFIIPMSLKWNTFNILPMGMFGENLSH